MGNQSKLMSAAMGAPLGRVQFSLLSLLCVVIALGAVIGLWISQRQTSALRVENRKLREELGVLIVDDPAKFYARSVQVNDNLKWRWRVYFPTEGRYSLHIQTGGIKDSGFASGQGSSSTFSIDPGEYTIEAEVHKTTPGQAEIHVLMPSGKSTTGAQTKQAGYDDWAGGSSSSTTLDQTSKEYDLTKPLELLRVRGMVQTGGGSSSTTPAPSPGLLIWIQREK